MGTTADKLNKLLETKSSIKQAIIDKGVDVSDTDTFESYAEKIGQISGGGGIPNYIAPKNNVNGVYQPDNTATSFSLNGATDIGIYGLAYAFYNCINLTSADLSSLTTISNNNAMAYCFSGCRGLTSADLSSLTTISATNAMNSCFQSCINLTSADLSSLTTISASNAMAYCFGGCIALKELSFPAITTTSFGTAKNQFNGMCSGCTDIVLHFPSNVESVIRGLSGYSDTRPFGATSGQVLFDLPSTEA